MCAMSFHFWLNTFAWTYRVKVVDESGKERPAKPHEAHCPFVSWPVQDDAADLLIEHIENGEDICIDKSRDMGATWLCLAVLTWMYLFRGEANFLLMSRNEAAVDDKGNPDTLFYKVRYMLKRCPEWMQFSTEDKFKHLRNERMNSTIDGEATTSSAGQGGRRTAIFLDEFARVPNGFDILNSTADTTSCRIFNSTPNGPGTAHTHVRFSGQTKVVKLMWWDHPEKGRNREIVTDQRTGKKRWDSPWLQLEMKRRTSQREIAENIWADHMSAGQIFFDSDELAQHESRNGRKERHRGDLDWSNMVDKDQADDNLKKANLDTIVWLPGSGRQPIRLWCDLNESMRPPQNTAYVIGVDTGHGQGSSNSVVEVMDIDTMEQVAELASSDLAPHEIARYAVAIGYWFGGLSFPPLIIPENNGPGGLVCQEIKKLQYPRLYQDIVPNTTTKTRTKKIGWASTRSKKEALLGELRAAIARDDVTLRSKELLNELNEYIFYENGGIGPAKLREDSTGAREAHGDRVIAMALCIEGAREMPKVRATRQIENSYTYAGRREAARRRANRRREDARWRG